MTTTKAMVTVKKAMVTVKVMVTVKKVMKVTKVKVATTLTPRIRIRFLWDPTTKWLSSAVKSPNPCSSKEKL